MSLRFAVAVISSLTLSACVGTPFEFAEYYPEASWGERAGAGTCPATPALEIRATNPDWLWIKVGIWNSYHTETWKLKGPTLFIHIFPGFHLSLAEQKRRNMTAISIKSLTPYLEIVLADGAKKRIALGHDQLENMWWRTVSSDITLGVAPQSMTVMFPDLLINGEPLRFGPVRFNYRKRMGNTC
jgi:hypothetical protein